MSVRLDEIERMVGVLQADHIVNWTWEVDDIAWLLALARGHQATLEQIAEYPFDGDVAEVIWLARERLREAEDE